MHNWPNISGNVNVKRNVNRMTVTLGIQGKSFQKFTHNKGNPLLFAIQYMTDSSYNNCCVYFHSRAMCSQVGFIIHQVIQSLIILGVWFPRSPKD